MELELSADGIGAKEGRNRSQGRTESDLSAYGVGFERGEQVSFDQRGFRSNRGDAKQNTEHSGYSVAAELLKSIKHEGCMCGETERHGRTRLNDVFGHENRVSK